VLGEEFLMLEETGTEGRGVADDRDPAGFHPQNAEAACLRYGSGTLLPQAGNC
jgi:hypothetical protein